MLDLIIYRFPQIKKMDLEKTLFFIGEGSSVIHQENRIYRVQIGQDYLDIRNRYCVYLLQQRQTAVRMFWQMPSVI